MASEPRTALWVDEVSSREDLRNTIVPVNSGMFEYSPGWDRYEARTLPERDPVPGSPEPTRMAMAPNTDWDGYTKSPSESKGRACPPPVGTGYLTYS